MDLGTLTFFKSSAYSTQKMLSQSRERATEKDLCSWNSRKIMRNMDVIHIKIKKAFDPENLFNPFLTEEIYGKF